MTVAAGVPPEVQEYLNTVREALADLPAEERDDLLAEVEASLAEAADEGEGPIAARLGPPQDFAAELRAAAGLHAGEPERPRSKQVVGFVEKLERWATRPLVVAARELGSELAPIWWAARGYLAVGLFAVATGTEWSRPVPVLPQFGTAVGGLVVVALAVALSIVLGLRSRRALGPAAWRAAQAAVNLLLLVAAIPVFSAVTDAAQSNDPVAIFVEPAPGLARDGVPLENIYPYSRQGRLLHDVLLYDSAGRPVDIQPNDPDPLRRTLRTRQGKPIFHSFPIRYFEPGTRRVARPNAGPPIRAPRLVTPELGR
jgi:hypothetical protein